MHIRPARPSDGHAIARVNNDGWRFGYDGIVDRRLIEALDEDRGAARWEAIVAEPAVSVVVADHQGELLGFAATEVHGDRGELSALFVAPRAWRTGIGRALLAHAERDMADQGATIGELAVLSANDRARQFYDALGWTTTGLRSKFQCRGAWHDVVLYSKALNAERIDLSVSSAAAAAN